MSIERSTLVGTAVALALFGGNLPARAQQTQASDPAQQSQSNDKKSQPVLQEVVVTGIRYSILRALEIKRASTGTVDVITAESIGKLPDKNVADALQRLPGIDISSASATEGAFDEADRVSMRGTSPSLTQTLIDGHFVATGDWFVLDQTGTVGRSVSYSLLPSEIVKTIKVYKSSEADLVEGGTAGTVDIETRKPLDFHQSFTLEAAAGAVYASNPDKTDPQFNMLGNWVNDERSFGVMVQLFAENRHLRRDGQEMLGYSQISPTLPSGAPNPVVVQDPDLANVWYPQSIGSVLFLQQRKRHGGILDVEWQPTDAMTLDFNGFASKMTASDVNYNYLLWPIHFVGAQNQGPIPGTYTVQNNTLTSGAWAPVKGNDYVVYDQISRPDEGSDTYFGVLSGTFKLGNSLSLYTEVGDATGDGRTPRQDVSETLPAVGTGAAYHLNGTTTAASWSTGPGAFQTSPTQGGTPVAFSWIFGDQNVDVVDAERWAKIDATYAMSGGMLTDLKFGARYSDHDRHDWGNIGQGPGCDGGPLNWGAPAPYYCANPAESGLNPANYPTGHQNYPSNWGDGLGSGFPNNIWYWTAGQLAAYNRLLTNRDPVGRADWSTDYGVHEKDTALYVQANFAGENWSGNAGVRFVRTDEGVAINVPSACTTISGSGDSATCASQPNIIVTSAFGQYQTNHIDNTYNDVLPSVNFKYNFTHDLIGRLDASETMTRPDYSALAGSISTTVQADPSGAAGDASGGNPYLRPTKSTNVDGGLEWYFAPKSLLAAELFHMDLKDYIAFGTYNAQLVTQITVNGKPVIFAGNYKVTAPYNADAKVDGIELSYTQSFFTYWGAELNYTYSDGKQTSAVAPGASDAMVGTSKDTANAILYFENKYFSARVAYTYRSSFFDGLDRSSAFTQAGIGTLAASLNWTISPKLNISLDGLNLNNPEYKYYALNTTQPRSFYRNGAQYYLNVHYKFL
jgi:iron complex outermembrane receptor protein